MSHRDVTVVPKCDLPFGGNCDLDFLASPSDSIESLLWNGVKSDALQASQVQSCSHLQFLGNAQHAPQIASQANNPLKNERIFWSVIDSDVALLLVGMPAFQSQQDPVTN